MCRRSPDRRTGRQAFVASHRPHAAVPARPPSLSRGSQPCRRLASWPTDPTPTAPYQALYRRFRPQRFADVLGQEHVTRALVTRYGTGRSPTPTCSAGPAGRARRRTARILAMALNCENPRGRRAGWDVRVMRRDPAGLLARRPGARLGYQPGDRRNAGPPGRVALGTPGRWKVYIVDEVHQLTPGASSALLKTLEEPPGHVIFVLATTDPQKVLPTIRSRTQHFEFRLLGPECWLRCCARSTTGCPRPSARSHRPGRAAGPRIGPRRPVRARPGGGRRGRRGRGDRGHRPGRRHCRPRPRPGARRGGRSCDGGPGPSPAGTDVLEYLRNGFLATQARSLVMCADDAAAIVEAQARRLGRRRWCGPWRSSARP